MQKSKEVYGKDADNISFIIRRNSRPRKYELTREMPVSECLQYGDDHREAIAEYKEFKDVLKNGWYLKDGRGTIQGHMCE